MSRPRVLLYVQHLLGIGHTVRAAQLTRAMQRKGMDVTYVSGGFDAIETDLSGAHVLRLPKLAHQVKQLTARVEKLEAPKDHKERG